MNIQGNRLINFILKSYIGLIFLFIFTPIITSLVFSFNSDRFASIPLGSFTLKWYETIYNDPDVWDAVRTSIIVAVSSSVLATGIGFCTAYTDFRYTFKFKNAYLALALLPPTIPLIIMALAMLAWFSKIGTSGSIFSVIIRSRSLEPWCNRVGSDAICGNSVCKTSYCVGSLPNNGSFI